MFHVNFSAITFTTSTTGNSMLSSNKNVGPRSRITTGSNLRVKGMLWLPYQGICHIICLSLAILDLQVIIFKQFYSTSLSQIELLWSENVLQALMISIDLTRYSMQVMFSNFQCKNHNRFS